MLGVHNTVSYRRKLLLDVHNKIDNSILFICRVFHSEYRLFPATSAYSRKVRNVCQGEMNTPVLKKFEVKVLFNNLDLFIIDVVVFLGSSSFGV